MSVRIEDTVVDCLRWTARQAPDNGITLYTRHGDQATVKYPELLRRAHRFACGLRQAGIAPGQRIGLYLPTSIEFFTTYFGALMARAVPVTTPVPAFGKSLNHREAHRLKSIVQDARMVRMVDGAGLDATDLVSGAQQRASFDELDALGGRQELELEPPRLSDAALIQYTSGSTSSPRGVVLSEQNISVNVQLIGHLVGMNPRDTIDLWIPLFHDMGLMGALTTIASGANLRICPPGAFLMDPFGWLLRFGSRGSTINPSPHFFFRMLLDEYDAERAKELDLSRWRVAFDGAEMIHPADVDRFQQVYGPHGFPATTLYPVYGLAESTLALSFPKYGALPRSVSGRDAFGEDCPKHFQQRRFISVGQALPHHAISLRPLTDAERGEGDLPEGVGEVMGKGPSIMQGYALAGNQELLRPFVDGWLPTRDLGFLHEGELFICGRMDEVLIVRGANYFPDELEGLVDQLGCFADAQLTGKAAFRLEGDAEGLALAVEVKRPPAGLDAMVRNLEGALLKELGFRVRVICVGHRALPRTTSGKLRRLALAGMLSRGELSDKLLAVGEGLELPGFGASR